MLGELISEERGQASGFRVIGSPEHPKVEVSFRAAGTLLGVEHTDIGTYESVIQSSGFLYGEGKGVVMGKNGERASWIGQGAGKFKQGGGISWRGSLYFQTDSPAFKQLNGIAVMFEHEVDANDQIVTKLWEWK